MSDPVFVYRISDLPSLLRGDVEPSDPIRACLFYAARGGSPAVAHAFARVPEPELEGVARWSKVAAEVGQSLARQPSAIDDLDPLDGPRRLGTGFHTGDAAAFEAALREGGAEVRDAAPLLAGIAWMEVDTSEQLYERWARHGTVRFAAMRPVRAWSEERPALYAISADAGGDLRAWTFFSRSGASVGASFVREGGGHRRTFEKRTPAALQVARDALAADEVDLERIALLLARREAATWQELGVTGALGAVHGLLSPAFIDVAGHLPWDPEAVRENARQMPAAMSAKDQEETLIAALLRWTRRLLADELDGPTGLVGSDWHSSLWLDLHHLNGLAPDEVSGIVDAEITRMCGG